MNRFFKTILPAVMILAAGFSHAQSSSDKIITLIVPTTRVVKNLSVGAFDNTVLLRVVCGDLVMVYVGEFQEYRHDG